MKNYFRILLFFLVESSFCLEKNTYSISVCTTSLKEDANRCKEDILKTSKADAFILENPNGTYSTYLGKFSTYNEAKRNLNTTSNFVKKQKPFVKEITKIEKKIKENYKEIENKSEKILVEEIRKKEEEEKVQPKLNELINLNNFDNLIITVDSKKNILEFKGQNNTELINIKIYKVSTAKAKIKKPLGEGYITSISLTPEWHPTAKTLKVFKEKGVSLPSTVPFGDKLNYMGAAKINLSHKVDGQEVYRIHGTLSEDTIGTNESSGCIRMRNKDVIELATLLNQYANLKNLNSIKVILL